MNAILRFSDAKCAYSPLNQLVKNSDVIQALELASQKAGICEIITLPKQRGFKDFHITKGLNFFPKALVQNNIVKRSFILLPLLQESTISTRPC